jgi:hypothetical protein
VSVPRHLADELNARALRNAMWLSIYLAQTLGLDDIAHRQTAMFVEVDERLELLMAR